MLTGGCLCGGVRYEVSAPPMFMAHCHCGECRKWSGAAHSTNVGVPPAQFRIVQGTDLLRPYRHEDRKDLAFCSRCGSSVLVIDTWPDGALVRLRMGTMDVECVDAPEPRPDSALPRPMVHAFVRWKAPWHAITDDVPQFAETVG